MTSTVEVCLDAGIAIKIAVEEPDTDKANELFRQWMAEKRQFIAPAFFEVEIDSILRK